MSLYYRLAISAPLYHCIENITMNNTLARMQNLVGQAGEALGITEDPLTTVAGVRVGAIITVMDRTVMSVVGR